jgi:manganese transport protein
MPVITGAMEEYLKAIYTLQRDRGSVSSSSYVGTMAGRVIMQGFVNVRIAAWIRRLATMIPALVAIYLNLNPTMTLVVSQVVLSFTLPIPVITLVMFTRNRALMGKLVNHPAVTALAIACAIILPLNFIVLSQALGGPLPKLG